MAHKTNWNDLQYVLAVAETGSLSAAARALGVNHATVLRRVAAFEAEQAAPVFERDRKGYRLRPEASRLIGALQSLRREVEGLERALAADPAALAGDVTVTTTDSLAVSVLPSAVEAIRRHHPGIRVILSNSNLRLNLARLDAEVTIRPAKEPPDGLSAVNAGTLGFAVYGSPRYLAEHPFAAHEHHDWLTGTEVLRHSPVWQWQAMLPEARVVARSGSFVDLARLAAQGLGLVMIPTCLGETMADLAPAPGIADRLETRLWVAFHADLADVPRIRTVTQHLIETLASSAEILNARPA